MSWAEEDWTVGLSGRVLQKVKELQVHQERLSRENKQKQLQLDNINVSLQKQNVKYEEVREEFHAVQRELQCVQNEAKAGVTSRERLTQDLQTKQAQICSFEGQLDAARTTNNKLTQEIKRLEAELEKIQNSNRSADTSLFSTPCWNTTSPWEHNGSRKEERHRDEGQNQASHIRQRLQFPEGCTSLLPQQQHKNTANFHPSNQSDVFSTPLAAFPWERDDSRPAARRHSPLSPQTPCADVFSPGQSEQSLCGKEKDRRTEADISLTEMRSRVSALEEELCAKAGALKLIQNDMLQSKKELASRDVNIQRTRNELSLAHTRMSQESERASGAEQRLKQLQEELKCQRQNAESSRLQHQQRTKELEKQHQRDLSELQKERQCLQKQHQQEVNKLNQELQQARTLHNALQAQADKSLNHNILHQLSLQKQALDKELDTLKEKLKWTEGQLQESQKKEAQTQAKLTEAVREAEGVAVSVEKSRKRERALEEEGRRLAEELADALRLLKELQEQKATPAPPQQTVQFSPVGQSSFPQHSYSPHSRPSTHINRPSTATSAEQTGEEEEEEDVFKRRAEITASYPSRDREPGEGIDSEHISPDSESSHRRKSNEEDNYVVIESDSSGPNKHSTFDHVLCSSSQSAATNPSRNSMDGDHFSEKAPLLKSEHSVASGELKRENARLLSELHDAREELKKRLEDLEAQRRAETEARTRLKQLSRKHASQAAGKEEQDKGWKAQLETERAEKEGLKNAMAALEMEMKRGREQREKREEQEEEKTRAQEDRESEMIELNIQLKKHLAEVKAQLALEREERKREEEQKNQKNKTDMDLSMKLEQLEAELEEINCIRKKDSLVEEKVSLAYSPLTYLILHDDKLNSNTVLCDKKLLPSPEQHLLFCQSTNQRNMFVSQATAGLIQEDGTVSDTECSPLSDEWQRSRVASHLEETRQNYLAGCSPSDQREALCNLQKGEPVPSHLAREMERLQKETATETERANHSQVKLEALQSQVTRQTQQLTMAFEKQSQHLSGLLAELQEKERELLSQGKELKRYKQELNALKAQKEGEEMTDKQEEDGEQKEGTRDERSVEISALQQHQEKESAVTFLTMNSLAEGDSSAHSDADHGVKRPTPVRGESDSEDLCSGDWDKSLQSDHDSACVMGDAGCGQDGGSADIVVELLALRQENLLLKQRIEGLSVPDTRNPSLHTDKKSQNTGDATLTCLAKQKSPSVPNDIPAEARQSPPQNEKGRENEVGDLEREEELEKELQIHHLHQQVVELHTQLQAFSEQTKQQAEELAVWRLASQPAPAFDQFPPNADNQCETQHHISAVRQPQSNQQQTYEVTQVLAPTLGVQESTSNMTIIREDELFLSSSSNKLQGRTLFSSLQHSNLPEPKCLHSSKKTLTLEEYNQDTAKIDEEKENQENNLLRPLNTCQTQHKEKRDSEVIQISSEKRGQHVTKDSHQPSPPKQTKAAEGYTGNIEAKGETSSATVEINTNYDSSDVRTEGKSVCSQTEKSLYLHSPPKASAYTQTEEEEEEEELAESPPISPVLLSTGTESGDKMLFSGSFPIPADPARLAERIRRNRTQLSAAFDDTEYEPYGLPEVVMKGFADIPSGPSCPYIVRRGLLGTTVKPVPQHDPKKTGQEEETD